MKTDMRTQANLKKTVIPYSETGFFSRLILDYLSENERIAPFYDVFPRLDNFEKAIQQKGATYKNRSALVSALEAQYKGAKLRSTGLEMLKSDNTFTVTTGHQVCLFTGPLYFFYKIVTAINTCRELKSRYPDKDFVPVFWMATEDHDFEEANHFFLPSGKIEWESGQGGAVGRMHTEGMRQVLDEFEAQIGLGYASGRLLDLFKKAYVNHKTIADATRYLVDGLFGSHGVVVVDGDDKSLKILAQDAFAKELTEQTANQAMEETNRELKKNGYPLQVKQHAVNLFYLDREFRERIEIKDPDTFAIARSSRTFSRMEMLKELEEHPEKFSPNVVLRPVYQEIILPNLAYVGGGGELAYWFQLKGVFQAFDVPFPMLMLRNSVMMVNSDIASDMHRLGIGVKSVFRPADELENELVKAASTAKLDLDAERDQLGDLFQHLEKRLYGIHPDLEKPVRSGHARADRIMHNLEKKVMRAERRKQNVLVSRLERIYDALIPRGGLQERNMNFTPYYLAYGEAFIEKLIESLDPFDFKFTVLTEE